MLPDRPFVLVGGGAFAIEIATYLVDIAKAAGGGSAILADVVDSGTPRTADIERIVGAPVRVHGSIGTVEDLENKLAIVCVGNPQARRKLFDAAVAAGARFGQIIHPTAYVAETAEMGEGVIVGPLSFIGPFARLEDNVAVNVQAAIGHDAVLEHSSVISPGVQVNGFARCGAASFVGAGAVLHPGVTLGPSSKLSAGSVLARSVGEGHLMHGNPAAGRQMISAPAPVA